MINQRQTLDQSVSVEGTAFKIGFRDTRFKPFAPGQTDVHIHDCYEIYLNLSGDVSFFVNNNVYEVNKGTVVLSRPNEIHYCICNSECRHQCYCLWFECADENLSKIIDKFNTVYTFAEHSQSKILSLFERLHEATEKEQQLAQTLSFLGIIEFLADNEGSPSAGGYMPDKVSEIIDYINGHYAEITSVSQLAEAFHISRSTLSRWFKQYIKLSPTDFIQEKKLAYAKYLLQSGKSVTEAGYAAGFCDSAYFILRFKNKFGITPHQYKKLAK